MAGYLYDGSCFICELLVYLQSVVEGTMSLGRPPIVTGVGWKAVSGIVMRSRWTHQSSRNTRCTYTLQKRARAMVDIISMPLVVTLAQVRQ